MRDSEYKHKESAARGDESKTTEHRRDCDSCGRDRPADPERFAVTASDFTDGTADFEKALLCRECWRAFRDGLRGPSGQLYIGCHGGGR